MTDKIIYCPDLIAFKGELQVKGFLDNHGNYTHGLIKTQTVARGNESLSLVRNYSCNFDNLVDLGTYEEVFENAENLAIYERVYQREFYYLDEKGETKAGLKPEKFGVFA